ncbi:MAG: hypothetical protein RLZ12_62 [Bacillota bacterium]
MQQKDIVNVADGCKLGRINDIEVDSITGRIKKLVVLSDTKLLNWFSNSTEWKIGWDNIVKIGADVILVKMDKDQEVDVTNMYELGTMTKIKM